MNCHPHFDLNLVVWDDKYSGQFTPPADYNNQFDLQWRLALEKANGYQEHPGADISDTYIDDRIYEWTGIHPKGGGFRDSSAGSRKLDHPVDPNLIKDKHCLVFAAVWAGGPVSCSVLTLDLFLVWTLPQMLLKVWQDLTQTFDK